MVSIITIRFFVLCSPKEYQRNKVPIITTRSLVLRCEARVKYSSNYDHCRFHVLAQPQFKILLVFYLILDFEENSDPQELFLRDDFFPCQKISFFTVLSYFVDWIKMKSKFMKQFNRTKAEIKFFFLLFDSFNFILILTGSSYFIKHSKLLFFSIHIKKGL